MGKQSNNQILLKELIKQEFADNSDFIDISTFFEFYASGQRMKEYKLSDEEIQNGMKGAGLDGGCDSVYIYLNNTLMNEEIINTLSSIKDAHITLHIIQTKHSISFNEDAIMKWKTISENLLKFENEIQSFAGRYNEDILNSFVMFKTLQMKLVRSNPKVTINFSYISLATDLHPNVQAQSDELRSTIKMLFPSPNTTVNVYFIGADELMETINTPTKDTFHIPLIESPIALGQETSYIVLIPLVDYFNFITDENKELRSNIFEANVRDYQGANSVNSEIKETLTNGTEENFWWLNNGVTMLASNAHQPTGKGLLVTDPEIVNGLQTSTEIYNYFINNKDALVSEKRSVLVRIIVPGDETSRDKIISATNNQTSIPKSSLRVTNLIHRQIEMYFKNKGLFYDRRKNYYKNQGRKSFEIISVSFLAQCLITLLLQQPDQARARPSTLLTDDAAYNKLYEGNYDLKVYLHSAQIGKKISTSVKNIKDLTPPEKSDVLFYILYTAVAKHLRKSILTSKDIFDLDPEQISDTHISEVTLFVVSFYKDSGGNGPVAKNTDFRKRLIAEFVKQFDLN